MNCPVCKSNMIKNKTLLTFNMKNDQILVIKDVPALVCEQCGEEFIDLETSRLVEKQVKKAVDDGLSMGFLNFNLAA